MTTPSTEAVWSALGADLRQFIRRRVSDEHTADDLLQETFARIHRHVGSLEEADRLAAWVYRIARNVIHDHYRAAGGHGATLPEDSPAPQPDDSRHDLQSRAGEWLPELVEQLPDLYRDAVQLAEIDGLPQHEIARRLGLSVSGAKSRIQRGRKLLKPILEQCCRFEFDRRGNLIEIDPRADRTVCRSCDA